MGRSRDGDLLISVTGGLLTYAVIEAVAGGVAPATGNIRLTLYSMQLNEYYLALSSCAFLILLFGGVYFYLGAVLVNSVAAVPLAYILVSLLEYTALGIR